MTRASRNDVRWGKKEAERGDLGAAGSAKVSFESGWLPGSSARRKAEKKAAASLPIHCFLSPFPPAMLGGSTGSRGARLPELGGRLHGWDARGYPLIGHASPQQRKRRRKRDGWSMAPGVCGGDRGYQAATRAVLRGWSLLVSSFLGPAPNSEVDASLGAMAHIPAGGTSG